jgi:hypothetical protein
VPTEAATTARPDLGVGWAASSTLALLDLRVRFQAEDPAAIALLEDLYAPARVDAAAEHVLLLGRAVGEEGEGWFAAADGTVLARSPAPGVAFRHLVFAANQAAIDATAGLRLHAAAAVRGGRAVLLPGVMNAGKSTLAAGLVQRGWAYLTDEVAALDGAGLVRPYPKPLSLGAAPAGLALDWTPAGGARPFLGSSGLVPAAALGRVATGPAPLAAVVLPEYERGAPTTIEALDPAEALVAIAAQVFHLDETGMLPTLADRLVGVPCARVRSGDLAAMCDAVTTFVDSVW